MNAKKLSTALLVAAVVTILLVFAFQVRIGATADSVAVLQTTGMTCGSCADKVSRALQSMKGVAATEVELDQGRVIVGYDTKMVRPESLAAKVSDTGFKSQVAKLLTPEQFRESAGRMVGQMAGQPSGCCGGRGGCCTEKASAGKER